MPTRRTVRSASASGSSSSSSRHHALPHAGYPANVPADASPVVPLHGLSMPCRVRSVITVDHLIVDIVGGCEIDLFLLGIVAPPAGERTEFGFELSDEARRQREIAADIVHRHGGRPTVFIPQPSFDRGWIRTIHPRSRHAGVLFFGDGVPTLNAQLAASGLVPTERGCEYLKADWPCRAVAARPATHAQAA